MDDISRTDRLRAKLIELAAAYSEQDPEVISLYVGNLLDMNDEEIVAEAEFNGIL